MWFHCYYYSIYYDSSTILISKKCIPHLAMIMIEIESNKCDFCGCCVGVCPVDCIELNEAEINIDMEVCIDCKLCIYVCPIEVLDHVETE